MTSIRCATCIILALFACANISCTDRTYASSTTTVPDNNTEPSNGTGPNSNGTEPGSNGTGPGSNGTVCRSEVVGVELGYVEGNLRELPDAFLGDGKVIFHQRATEGANSPQDVDIFQINPENGDLEQLTANDSDDYVVDSDGAALLVITALQGGGSSLQYIDQNGAQELDPSPFFQVWDDSRSVRHRQVQQDIAVWKTSTDGIALWANGRTQTISGDYVNNNAPTLDNGQVAWSRYDGNDQEIALFDGTTTSMLTDNTTNEREVLISEGSVFWISANNTNADVWLYDIATQARQMIHEGNCTLGDAENGKLLFLCSTEANADNVELWHFNGETSVLLKTGTEMLLNPRLEGDRFAWLEYESSDAWCNGNGIGNVMLIDGDQAPQALDTIGAGCWCCGAIWPNARLEFSNDMLAWNYAIDGELGGQQPHRVGYATLKSEQICQP